MDRNELCSQRWQDLEVPAWGTAPQAEFWLLIEQPGPWGAKAVAESGLDAALGARLAQLVNDAGGELLLIRRPGRSELGSTRTVYLGGDDVLLRADIADPAALTDLDFAQWRSASRSAGFMPSDPIVAICANGKRDQCCSLFGRDVAAAAGRQRPNAVWECSHLHGHRFAPTAISFPGALLIAQITPELAVAQVDAAARLALAPGVLAPERYRGRCSLGKPEQVAEAAARISWGELGLTTLTVTERAEGYVVTAPDGRTVTASVSKRAVGEQFLSCGKASQPQEVFDATVSGNAPERDGWRRD